jgi:hypothetical protein
MKSSSAHFLCLYLTVGFVWQSGSASRSTVAKSKFTNPFGCFIRNLKYPKEYLFNTQLETDKKTGSNVFTKVLKPSSGDDRFFIRVFDELYTNETYMLKNQIQVQNYLPRVVFYLCLGKTNQTVIATRTVKENSKCFWHLTPVSSARYPPKAHTLFEDGFEITYMISNVASGGSLMAGVQLPFIASTQYRKVELRPAKSVRKLPDQFQWNIECNRWATWEI